MFKRNIIYLLIFILLIPVQITAQSISLQVIAVKGTIKYQSSVLKRGDVINVSNPAQLNTSLNYSTASDWVNFMNKKDKKILNYYASKAKGADGRYMFSRGMDSNEIPPSWQVPGVKHLQGESEVLSYFDRPLIFLFGADTLVCSGMKVYEITDGNGFMLEFSADSLQYSPMLGQSDTLFISRGQLFSTSDASTYDAGPMKLIYFNKNNEQKNYLDIEEFNIYFLEDIVHGFRALGMNNKNIISEIMFVFSNQEQLEAISGFRETKDIESWLLKKIKKIR